MSTLDTLRGLYVRLPPPVRRSLAPLASVLPWPLRWGSSYRRLRAALAGHETSAAFVAAWQERALAEIHDLCLTTEAYRPQLSRSHTLRSPAEKAQAVRALPVLSKEMVRRSPEAFLARPASTLDLVSTSGSSGQPFHFYLDRDRGAREWAFVHHIWGHIGYHPHDRRAVLRGVAIPNVDRQPWSFDPALGELVLSPFHLVPPVMDHYLEQIQRRRVRFLHGYPSALAILAGHALRRGWQPPSCLKGVLPVSETLWPSQRELIRQAFRLPILALYGLSEKVAIAGERPNRPGHYVFEPLYSLVELVDEAGEPVLEPGRIGRLVGTGFVSKGMPLVRYDTGDVAELVRVASPNSGWRLEVRGLRARRALEMVVGAGGALVSMTAINIHSQAYCHIEAFQLRQDKPGEVTINVVPVKGANRGDLEPFAQEIQSKVGQGIRFRLELVEALPAGARGKRLLVDQRLDLATFGGGPVA
ncbi:MAG: hypothetical protein AB1634_17840 [Thermodesulfobacteriota bacterium]